MGSKRFLSIGIILLGMASVFFPGLSAQDTVFGRHTEVSLRQIGHQILLDAGDSTSLVLPIEKEDDRYRIRFGSEFGFIPEDLVATINRVVQETNIADEYIVEVENCETGEVVYSYEVHDPVQTNLLPCLSRAQPSACYTLLFTLLRRGGLKMAWQYESVVPPVQPTGGNGLTYMIVLVLSLLIATAFYFLRKRKNTPAREPELIPLGEFRFDKKNTELHYAGQKIELTGKEADLLELLYGAVNTTVERDVILNRVWGDEGEYVGRTLDVFISRLRKKLGADAGVKIVNIRGIGYKLVLEG